MQNSPYGPHGVGSDPRSISRPGNLPREPSIAEDIERVARARALADYSTPYQLKRRPGPLVAVIRMFAYGWDRDATTVDKLELYSRSWLAGIITLTLFVVLLVVAGTAIRDPVTLFTILSVAFVVLMAGVANRAGYVRTCGTVLVIAVTAAVLIGVHVSEASLSHGELDTIYLPTYDLMALPILIAGSVLPRPWIPFAGILAAGGFLADFLALERPGGDLVRWLSFEGPIPLVARTLALLILVTVVAFLWGTRLQRLLHDKLIAQSQADAELTRRAVEEQRRYMADDFKNGVQQLAARMLQGYSTPDQARIILTHSDNPYRGSAQFIEHVIHRLGKALSDERRRADDAERRAGQLAAQLGGMAPRPGMPQQQTGPLPHDVPRSPPAPPRMSAADLVDPSMLRTFGGQSQPERPTNDPTNPWPHRP